MPSDEDIADQQALLATHRRTLTFYLTQQAALSGPFTPPGVSYGIREARDSIRRIKDILRTWGVLIEDHPDDEVGDSLERQPEQSLKTKDRGQLLREAGEALRQKEEAYASAILEDIERTFEGNFGQRMSILRTVLTSLVPPDLSLADAVIDAAFQLWDVGDEDAREIVVRSLVWVQQQLGGVELLRERFTPAGAKERRLLRDSRLKDIAPNLAQHQYRWPPLQHKTRIVESPEVAVWLEANDLTCNPFGSGLIEFDPLLLGSRAYPDQWSTIVAPMPALIRGATQRDCAAVALFLHHELQSDAPQSIFPVALTLPFAGNRRQNRRFDPLQAIAQASGETWIGLLAHNPAALLDLPPFVQAALADLLVWTAGSYYLLHLRLSQAGLTEDVEGRMLLRRLEEPSGTAQQKRQPDQDKLMSWLSIRPPELQYTYVITECRLAHADGQCQKQTAGFVRQAADLERISVIVKLFVPALIDTDDLRREIDIVPLIWAPQRLEKMLNDRIILASKNNYRAFKDLFGPVLTVDPDSMLAKHANGSLSTMLDLGNRVIHAHVSRPLDDLEYKYLDQSDIDIIQPTSTLITKAQPADQVMLELDYDARKFTNIEQGLFISQLARVIHIDTDRIHIVRVQSGSVGIVLEMPKEGVERLAEMYVVGHPALRELHIIKVEVRKFDTPISEPTIAIITALPHEYAAVKVMLENQRSETAPRSSVGWQYLLGEIPGANGCRHSLVLSLAGKGNNMASSCATSLLMQFQKIEIIIMVGIAGGVPYPERPDDHVRLGDVVVSSQYGAVQYDFIKQIDDTIQYRNPPRPPSAKFLRYANLLAASEIEGEYPWMSLTQQALKRLKVARPSAKKDILVSISDLPQTIPHPKDSKRKRGQPRIFIGPIASADKLLKSSHERDALRDRFGVKAIEMEGSGIADAAWNLEKNYLIIRGICDYCDSNKNDEWQNYAAVIAAAYTRALIESIPC